MPNADSSYRELNEKLKRQSLLGSVSGLLGWDEQVNLPPDSQDLRQDQLAALSAVIHEANTDPEIGAQLAILEALELSDDQTVVVREARKRYDRATKTTADWVERHSRHCSEAYHAWAAARKNSDFKTFAPYLQKHIDLAKEQAQLWGWGDRPYDLMIDLHDPGMSAAAIDELFSDLRDQLAPVAIRILASAVRPRTDIFRGFPVSQQKAFLEEVTASLGFNYRRGRIDISLHPFCAGNGADIRMTTRFDENNPLDSLFSSIHETGHGLYEQGLPLHALHNALGQASGMGVHESQSRLWENQVARSRSFWKHFEPKLRAAFSEQLAGISSEALYLAINSVSRTPIRVDADEVTYNLHIVIRFEIEKKLFSGELSVSELPEYWNAQYGELLGVAPRDDAEGALQDIHWAYGSFGYFPTYCLGNMLAAQLWYAAQADLPGIEADFERGEFARLLDWLRGTIHRHGSRYTLQELAEIATGQSLSPRSLIRYLEERYLPLYA